MLIAPELDLEEGRMMVDPKRLKLPEDDGGVFGRELLIAPIIVERARQDGIVFLRGKLFQRADAGIELHQLGKLRQMPLRLFRRKAAAILENGDVELKYAVRPDPQCRVGISIGDLEMVSQIPLAAELAGFDRGLVVYGVFGERPFSESRRQGFRHRQR